MVRKRKGSVSIAAGTATSVVVHALQQNAERRALQIAGGGSSGVRIVTPVEVMDIKQALINAAPGCYQHDDGSHDVAMRYNFYAHGKRFLFAPCSLGIFHEWSRFRQALIWCITWKRFDQFILLLIFANSIILAIADYSKIDETGALDSSQSYRNAVVNTADGIFTTLFSIECTMKIIAMGLFGEPGAYLMDPWNWLDFIVVFIGILAVLPGIPNVSALRTFRVLRPLRSLNAVAGMKKLVTALLRSIPELLTVVAFLAFLFFLYGVIGVQLWSGALHPRCRLTPYPVRLDANLTIETLPAYQAQVLANHSAFLCVDVNNDPIPLDHDETHDTSPWRTPRLCYWPIAEEKSAQTCALGSSNYRQCPTGQTCGSDYDMFGNFRFHHPDDQIMRYVLESATYNADMNWGYVNFDHIGTASLAIFLCITREGWSDIMYTLQDAGYSIVAVCYFVTFIILGSYFMLNLTLAVIWENFSDASLLEADERKQLKEMAARVARAEAKLAMHASGPTSRFRLFVRGIVQHWGFNALRILLILVNTIILSLDQYPQDPRVDRAVEAINATLTIAFLLECSLKIIGLGWTMWFRDRYNIFDAVVVALGVVELVISPPEAFFGERSSTKQTGSFSGLRSVRLFALFKLARSWPSLQKLLSTMVSTIGEVGNFCILFLLFMYIYALIGMQTFANQFRFDSHGFPVSTANNVDVTIPRSNFDTMLWSMVTVFQILTGENWNVVMFDGWRSSGWSAVLYFISLVVLGNFIMLNLFLAILLGNFEESSDDEKREAREREELKKRARVAPSSRRSCRESQDDSPGSCLSISEGGHRSPGPSHHGGLISSRSYNEHGGGQASMRSFNERGGGGVSGRSFNEHRSTNGTSKQSASTRSRRGTVSTSRVFDDGRPPQKRHAESAATLTFTGRALFIFSTRNPIRRVAIKLISSPNFDNISLVLIVISTIALAIDNPLNPPDDLLVVILSVVDVVLTGLFLVEVVIKILAQGFLLGPHAYLRNYWNVMDFVITSLAAFSLSEGSSRFKFVKTLRTFRALRPLRMIHRNPGLKLVVSSLIASIPQILNVIVVCFLVFTIFSIIAVNNLKGKLYSCRGDAFDAMSAAQQDLVTYPRPWYNLTSEEQAWFNTSSSAVLAAMTQLPVTSRAVCGALGAEWGKTIPQSFDNVLHGCQTFFEMTTTEGWVTIMIASIDATEIDMQPIPNYREGWAFFFIAFILVGTFFVMQLFVGVVIENFNRMKEKLDGTYLLSTAQRELLIINDAMLNLRPLRKVRMPQHQLRRKMYQLARSATFEIFIVGCIILNTVVMGLHYFGEEDLYGVAIEYSNYIFALIFTVEAAIKIGGLGVYYWKDSWNIFDFVVVLGTLIGMVYQWAGGNSVGTAASVIRSFRVGRLFRLIQSAQSLRQLFNTLMITLPSLVNIGGLLFLVFFIYAAMGVQLFAKVKFGSLITPTINFQSITTAMITLVRCATGERWNDLMYELASQDNCSPDPSYDPTVCGFNDTEGCKAIDGCGSPVAYVYLYSFTLLVSFILLNIFIAVILEGFANEKEKADGILLPHHYENFVETWSMFDKQATGFIEWHVLPSFLAALGPPIGFEPGSKPTTKELAAFVESLDLPIFRGNKVFFNDVARRVGKYVVDEMSTEPLKSLPPLLHMDQRWRKFLQSRNIKRQDLTVFRVNQFSAAMTIHTAVKAAIFRTELKENVIKFTKKTAPLYAPPLPRIASVVESTVSRPSIVHTLWGEEGEEADMLH